MSDKWEDFVEEPQPCPYPDCDGHIVGMVERNWGADRDGNRGIDVYWAECNKCECDPHDYNPDDWV